MDGGLSVNELNGGDSDADVAFDTTIEELCKNLCELRSSTNHSPSRQSFGSYGDEESKIDSDLQHLALGESPDLDITEDEEEEEEEEERKVATKVEEFDAVRPASAAAAKPSSSEVIMPKDTEKQVGKKNANLGLGNAARKKKVQNEEPSSELARFLLNQARNLISSGESINKALELSLRAAKLFEASADKKKPCLEQIMCLHVTAAIHCKLKEYNEAIPILQRSIELSLIEEGEEGYALAKFAGLMQLGDTYAMTGQLENSVSCYTEGLTIQKKFLGENDPRVGETCRYLAEALVQALRFDEAEKLCQTALSIHRQNGSPGSTAEAADRRLMGLICETKGDHENALEHLVLASMAMSSANGREEDDSEVAFVDASIGDSYLSLSRFDEAISAYHKSLTALKTAKGENHPSVGSVYIRLADLYNRTGKTREAKSYIDNALRIYDDSQHTLEISPEEIASGLTEISVICESMNEVERAVTLLQKALKIYGDGGPGQKMMVAGIEAQMGVLYYMMGKHLDSYNTFKSAVSKLRGTGTGKKQSTFYGIALNQMGLACVQLGEIEEGVELFEEAKRVLEQECGMYHPETLGVYNNLAGAYDAMGRLEDAIALLGHVVGAREEKLGTANVDTEEEKGRLVQLLKEAERKPVRLPPPFASTMFEYRCNSINWKPSPLVSLATSPDGSRVAAAREDGSLELWLVSPGSLSWHSQLIIHGDPKSRISHLAWVGARLFSSSIDGTISEWDLFDLKQKVVLDSIGVSIWQMAVAPPSTSEAEMMVKNGYLSEKSDDDEGESGVEDDSEFEEKSEEVRDRRLAVACDDGCVRIYYVSESEKLTYFRSLPRVSGRALSVTWSLDAQRIFSGSSDGLIRCWDANLCHEVYRITVGLGGLGNGSELCIWSLLSLRCGVLVSGDSTGSVQFWDSQHGTLLQSHSNHKGDVNTLAAAPSHNRVFSAGADGQVILYKLAGGTFKPQDSKPTSTKKWDYIGCVRAHTHDIRALTVAVPISSEGSLPDGNAKGKSRKQRRKEKPGAISYHKWAHLGVPVLISAGDDAKLFAYSVQEFTKFHPHDICPAPQRVPMQMVHNTVFSQTSLLLVQDSCSLDILRIHISNDSSGSVSTKPLVRVKSKGGRKIMCSAISNAGSLFAYSDQIRPSLFELKKNKLGKNPWSPNRKRLPNLPSAHSMVFSCDCSRLIIAGHDRKIYTVGTDSMELLHTLTPRQEAQEGESPPREPPVTKLYTSTDDHWLAAINCFGDVYVFNLETQRQHWFISRLDGASVAAAGFHPRDNNVLVISTSSNQVFALDVEARELGKWSLLQTLCLPKRYQEIPGEVLGLSFSPSPSSSSVIIYSSRAKCLIEFGKPMEQGEEMDLSERVEDRVADIGLKKLGNGTRRKRRFEEYQKESTRNEREEVETSKHPVLYLKHLSKNAILVVEKPWIEVIKSLDSQPVHRHIYGT